MAFAERIDSPGANKPRNAGATAFLELLKAGETRSRAKPAYQAPAPAPKVEEQPAPAPEASTEQPAAPPAEGEVKPQE